jgi:outer membrane protein OmpA-like peptidoglycan-associated protein
METARTAAAAVTWAAAESEAAAAEAQASTPVLAEAGALSASGDRLMRAGEYGAAPPAILGLTIEAVEFASQPCGTLFRWCGAMLRSALALLRAREELTCRLATQSKRLHGLQSEAAAVSTFSDSLERDYAEVRSCREVAEGRRAAARAVRVRTELALNDAMTQLAAARGEAARAVAAAAEAEAAAAREAAEREERRVARGVARKEAQARAAAAVEKALAEQREAAQVAVADKAAWVHTETLAPVRPIEFGPHGSDLGPETKLVVHTLVRALLAKPELRLHIAGHSAEDEEPKLSSSRAQAVGAALIAAGAPPNRLRAKGYGSTVPLTPPQRARLRLRSERRVTVHAIAAVRTTVPLCFDECSAELGTQMGWVVEGVVALLREQPHLRLSVEGHADPTEGRRIPRGEGNQILPGGEREVPVAAPPDTPADSTQGRRMPPGAKLEVPAAAPPGAVLVARGSALWGDSKRRETNSTKGRKERAASAARGNVASNTDGGEAVSIVESPAGGSGDDTPWVHALALQRSIAVRDALMAAGGVMASRLVHHAFGDSLPVVADSMREEGRAANRRVELLIIPDVAIAERGGLA